MKKESKKKRKKEFDDNKIKLKQRIKKCKYFVPENKVCDSTENLSWFDVESYNYSEHVQQTPPMQNILDNNIFLRAKQVKLYLTDTQKKMIDEWIEVARLIYNLTVKYFKTNKLCSFITVRSIIHNLYPESLRKRIILTKVPVHVTDNAISDVCKAYKTSIALIKAKYIKCFKIRYKKLTKPKQTIVLEKQDYSLSKKCFYPSKLGFIQMSHDLSILHDCRLTRDFGTYILNVPCDKEYKTQYKQYKECGIDPGNKTFLTVFNPEGECLKIFNRDKVKRLTNKIKKKYKLKKLIFKTNLKKYSNALLKNNKQIRDLVKELHYKSAIELCKKFDTICLGNLSTRSIVQGNLSSFEKEYTHALSHYTFNTILKNKCQEYNKKFILVNESYTTKTCGICGEINNVKCSRIINCIHCKQCIDRDMNGARNILIKQ